MANPDHLAILKKGVEAWNQWRVQSPQINPNLCGANLESINLSSANLSSTKLSFADLCSTNLHNADLRNADLSAADLRNADLRNAQLDNTNFTFANLCAADLSRTNLCSANLRNAGLCNADLSWTDLHNVDFNNANLSYADLRNANLSFANLASIEISYAQLVHANLFSANLNKADLSFTKLNFANFVNARLRYARFNFARFSFAKMMNADLRNTDMRSADLWSADFRYAKINNANLTRVQALGANFSHATLTGACIEDWHINGKTQFQDTKCKYIYLRYNPLTDIDKDFDHRRPHDLKRFFASGEFTQRFQKVLATVDLFFADGIDWKAFLASFQDLQAQYGDDNLMVQGFERKGNGFEVRLAVSSNLDKAEIERNAFQKYEAQLQLTETWYRAELHAKDIEIEGYRRENANMMGILQNLAAQQINVSVKVEAVADNQSKNITNNISNNKFGGGAAFGENASQSGGTFYDLSTNVDNNLDDIAHLIQSLRQLAQTFPSPQQGDAIDYLKDLEGDIQQPPEKRKPSRVKATLMALLALSIGIGGAIATATDFTNNVLELSNKLGIELVQPQATQQPNLINLKAIEGSQNLD